MFLGKKFPMCMRTLRMVVEAILIQIIDDLELAMQNYDVFMANLEERALKSKTCKLWVDCLVRPVLLMMKYVC